ncbi:hypothetical protein [Ligilactobacillus salivarius]|uniref:Uncharacterized protein n=1 Tax=Ligilactobacillus salivarius TaxID=1624 RepID=A0A9X6S9K9_9LACO|nr:hypothetical protein [Ligilactobacillus salivarius]MBE7387257.1 hypothetical protein [Ligilactobacillus salivarius]MBE7391651.1 hypothetical protein [Ligilactobacillus salivarius]PAY26309.1 hypothetical protein A8C33_08715 [Ligilactobacillus salivarius]PAY27459.1 hypothetical protein A8C49_09710 [Ligilactobacillus salivarius]PAY30146.1 hypothetical protein A8C44_08985 [Ligilactobacillus salivarius]
MANKSKKIDERIEEAYRNSILEKKSRKPKLKETKSKLPIKIKAAIISLLTSATELMLIYYGKTDFLKQLGYQVHSFNIYGLSIIYAVLCGSILYLMKNINLSFSIGYLILTGVLFISIFFLAIIGAYNIEIIQTLTSLAFIILVSTLIVVLVEGYYESFFDWLKKDSDDKYDIAKIIFIWGIITWIIGMVSTFK